MEADCSFLITTAVVLPSGYFQLCVQANDQVSAQSWEVYQFNLSSTPVQTGTNPNMCWTLDGSDPLIFIFHYVDGGNPCTRVIRIVSDELCPEGIVQADVNNCNLETVVSIDDSNIGVPYVITFGDGTSEIVDDNLFTHVFPGPGNYNLCYTKEVFPGNTITCCQQVNIPGCCLDASFTLAPDYENGWASCYNPSYIITPTACLNPIIELTHIWELSDGTVYYQPFPPVHTFTNFLNTEGEVCVTHTIICCEESVSETVCVANAFFTGGVWNMGRNSEIVVQGKDGPALPFQARQFRLSGTTIRSAVRLGSPLFAACCRWKGIRSEKLTAITLTNAATLMDAEYAIHYPSMSAGFLFPSLHSVDAVFENNFFAIKSVGQHVRFPRFHGNILNGASMDPHVCGCTAVNAIDFRDAGGAALTINISDLGFGANEIFNYEKGFNFQNTRLMARGFDIRGLREFDDSPGVPNNGPGPMNAAIGIDYSWRNSGNSLLNIDEIRFSDFEAQNARSVAVRQNIIGGNHTLTAIANQPLTSIKTSNIAGGYEVFVSGTANLNGTIQGNSISTNGGLFGFGINGNMISANNTLNVVGNTIDINSNSNSTLNGGVILISSGTSQNFQNFKIVDNIIDVSLDQGAGIGLTNVRNYIVRRNTLTNGSDVTGIQLHFGGTGLVDCNNVRNKPLGMDVILSTGVRYAANFFRGNEHDVMFSGDVAGNLAFPTRIQWNIFRNYGGPSNIYNSAIVGTQFHTNYNRWEFPGSAEPTILLQGSNPGFNQYWRPIGAAQGTPMYPTSEPANLFIQALNSSIDTIPSPSSFCTSDFDGFNEFSPDPDPEAYWAAIVLDTGYWNGLTPAEHTYMRQEVYGLLLDNPGWTSLDTTLSGFQASEDAGFAGQSETLRHTWKQLMESISAHQATLGPIYSAVDSLAEKAQLWVEAMHADTTLQDSLQALLEAVLQQGDSLNVLIQQADFLFYPSVMDSVSLLLAQNATLDEDSLYTWYEKRYNEIALKWLAGAVPDSTAAADLRTIAQTCLPDGGRAVLDARGLCAVWLKEYYDEGNCSSLQSRSVDGAASENAISPDLRIVPNPADDMFWISLQGTAAEGQQVQVFSIDGRQVFSGMLPGSGSLAIPVKDWQGGLYIVKITGEGTAIARKFMVQHP